MRESELQQAVVGAIKQVVKEERLLGALLESIIILADPSVDSPQVPMLQQEFSRMNAEIRKLLSLRQKENTEQYDTALSALEAERDSVLEELEKLTRTEESETMQLQIVGDMLAVFNGTPPPLMEFNAEVAHQTIQAVVVQSEVNCLIQFKDGMEAHVPFVNKS